MGKSVSKNREEYNKSSLKCRGYVDKYSFKSGTSKRKYFVLNQTSLGYSKSKEIAITHSTQIEKGFKILYSDMEKNEICIECLTDRGEISLWRLIFSSQKNTEKWLEKLKKAVRPEWEDPNTGFCSICAKPFKLFRRQHHCRKCGKVICANHSKMIENLSELGYEQKVRICVTCVNRIGNINGVQRARSLGEKEKERNSTLMYNSIVGFNGTSSVLGFNK